MSDLISRKFLLSHECEADRMGAMLVVGKGWILEAPTVDAVEVVRCKGCAHAHREYSPRFKGDTEEHYLCGMTKDYRKPNSFCSSGKCRESEVSE